MIKNANIYCSIILFLNMIMSLFWAPIWLIIILNIFNILSIICLLLDNKKIISSLKNNYNTLLLASESASESLSHIKQCIEVHQQEKQILLNKISNIANSIKE